MAIDLAGKTQTEVAGVVLFEVIPFARFACWGEFRATTPGGGISLGVAYFSLDA